MTAVGGHRWLRRVRRTVPRLCVAALLVAVMGTISSASVVVPLSLRQLVEASAVVVDAEVIAVHATADRGRVERVVTIRVRDTWMGQVLSVAHVRLAGGEYGRTRVVVPGVPEVAEGERLVWFLTRDGTGALAVVGLHQGAWRVTRSALDGRPLVGPATTLTQRGVVRRGDGTRRPRPLADLHRDVRAILEGLR